MKVPFLFLTLLVSICAHAQLLTPQVDSIPMRDGKKIAADIHIPSSCTQCPVILIQTPYNRLLLRFGLPLGVGTDIDSSDYIFVVTDWRGFFGSAAAISGSADQGEDGYDVIDWIAAQTWCDGNVGTWGPSALGKVQYTTAREQHPNHKCAVPQVAGPQFNYADYYYGGVLEESHLEQLDNLGFGLSTIVMAHQTYDFVWTLAEAGSFYPDSIVIPMFIQGGWYDHATRNELEWFAGLKSNSPAAAQHKLIIGPWVHGGFGTANVGSATQGELSYPNAAGVQNDMALDFFDYYLRGISNGWNLTPDVTYYQMGTDTWESATSWPTTDVSPHTLYLHSGGLLLREIPGNTSGASTYLYDPKDPSPTIGGSTLHTTLDQGPYDQSQLVETRNDLAAFTSVLLGEDVVMKGELVAHLKVSTDRKDTDFAIRLTDVYPDGRSMLITDGIRRLRFRNGYGNSDTSVAVPGNIYDLEITLPPTSYTFKSGHQIRIDITSSNSRRWDVNLNNGGPMYTSGDTLIATNSVYHNSMDASYIELPIVDYEGSVHEEIDFSWQVYPNPAASEISVTASEPFAGVAIYNLDGRLINRLNANNTSVQMNVTGFTPGIYFIKATTRSGRILTQKLIITQ